MSKLAKYGHAENKPNKPNEKKGNTPNTKGEPEKKKVATT